MNVIVESKIRLVVFAVAILFLGEVFLPRSVFCASTVTLSATPTTQTVTVGQSAVFTIKINRDGFSDKVTLSVSSLPAGVTASFNPNPVAGNSSQLTLKTSPGTPVGLFSLKISGAAPGITISPLIVKLETKPAASVSIAANPQAQSIVAGQETSFEIALDRFNYEGPVVFSAENLPAGLIAKFEPPETTGNTAQMRLYSNGLPFLPDDLGVTITAAPRDPAVPKHTTLVKLRVNCDIAWAEQFGVPDNQTFRPDFGTDVALDAAGNVYIAGNTQVPDQDGVFRNNFDAWVAKFSPGGNRLWLTTLDLGSLQSLENRATVVAVDPGGRVFVGGFTRTGSSFVNFDIFLVELNSSGSQVHSKTFGNNLEDGSARMDLRFDSSNRPVLTAAFDIRRNGRTDFKIARVTFDANLNIVSGFPNPLITNLLGEPFEIKNGNDGSIYVVGFDLDLNTLAPFGWVKKFTPGGALVWSRNQEQDTHAEAVAIDGGGNVFVGKRFFLDQMGIIKFDPNGGVLWEVPATQTSATISDMTVDSNGDLFLTGKVFGNLAAVNPDPLGRSDGWLAKRSGADGHLIFVRQFAVADKDEFNAFQIGSDGSLYVAGDTVGFKNVNFGFEDAFLMKYSPDPSNSFPLFLPAITAVSPATVQSEGTIIITGNNLSGVESVFFNGRFIRFRVVSPTEIRATAPRVDFSETGVLSVSTACEVYPSEVVLTVNP
ncbi:MAG: SBBP repeat-containing protein [Pyrinomonadaceae bacterium]